MAKKQEDAETSVLPEKFVDLVEDGFHAILALALLGVGLMAGISWARKHMTELSKPPDTGA